MLIALLSTGDELIHGDTLNTNAQALSKGLSAAGLPLGLQVTASDKESELLASLRFLTANHDILILMGGLGPTSDDRTRFALAACLNINLIEFPEAIEHIERCLKQSRSMNVGDKQQAFFPGNARLFPNPHGTAMGCHFSCKEKQFILLPGPPKECLPMFEQFVLPLLEQQGQQSHKVILRWRLFGLAESQMAAYLEAALAGINCQRGYRLDVPYVEFKLRCYPEQVTSIQRILEPIITPLLIASVEEKASEKLASAIAYWKVPISIQDEATGGLLQTLIQNPHSVNFVQFSSDVNARFDCHIKGLRAYWDQTQETKTCLEISLTDLQDPEKNPIHEVHEIPYRNERLLHYAAEWVSFRLFSLIKNIIP